MLASRSVFECLLPAVGVRVGVKLSVGTVAGLVENWRVHDGKTEVGVKTARGLVWVAPSLLEPTLRVGSEIIEEPIGLYSSLGQGEVRALRRFGEQTQALVEFWHHDSRWLPWQNLRHIVGVSERFEKHRAAALDVAERFRLRALSHALEQWNLNSGVLARLDIDPLPHQLHLVDSILKSGNLNWLIADDVGLGKTVEVGLLLYALLKRDVRRVLIVVPSGLTRQWQEELHFKFRLDDFEIYGRDFEVHTDNGWRGHDRVIASMDRLKHKRHLDLVRASGRWDLVVFDEAHRLSRGQYGLKFSPSQRYTLAANLRTMSDALLLLTGTPHQGKDDKFFALIELLRPEWSKALRKGMWEPSMGRACIFRNRKADVTDLEGNFVFQGKVTHLIPVQLTDGELAFDAFLQHYLTEGYKASERGGTSRAIGFVMTTYRKLAASSLRAIVGALKRRCDNLTRKATMVVKTDISIRAFQWLTAENEDQTRVDDSLAEESVDARYYGEAEEVAVDAVDEGLFFTGELEMLSELIEQGSSLLDHDSKLKFFISTLITEILHGDSKRKVLIFTEYRATQQYLSEALETRFGVGSVTTIHGSKSVEERLEAIELFEGAAQFLVSTEAGGEGLNLQRYCYTMVNFDLPWNPMRLVQRVGRLYRYGQRHPVVVFNTRVLDTLDGRVISTMYERLDSVARTMAGVGDEYRRDAMIEDIVGQLSEAIDVAGILEAAAQLTIERTEERLAAAAERAREATVRQAELLNGASRYDPNLVTDGLTVGEMHIAAFLEGMFAILGATCTRAGGQRNWNVNLPEALREQLGWRRQHWRVTLERTARGDGVHVLSAESVLWRYLVSAAQSTDFGGRVAALQGGSGVALAVATLRWRNERGLALRSEFAAVSIDTAGVTQLNPHEFNDWLLHPQAKADLPPPTPDAARMLTAFAAAFDQRLERGSNRDLQPGGKMLIAAGWSVKN